VEKAGPKGKSVEHLSRTPVKKFKWGLGKGNSMEKAGPKEKSVEHVSKTPKKFRWDRSKAKSMETVEDRVSLFCFT
jgi:hypothetical protein